MAGLPESIKPVDSKTWLTCSPIVAQAHQISFFDVALLISLPDNEIVSSEKSTTVERGSGTNPEGGESLAAETKIGTHEGDVRLKSANPSGGCFPDRGGPVIALCPSRSRRLMIFFILAPFSYVLPP